MYWYCKEKPDVDQFIFRAKPAIPPHHWREKAVQIQAKDQVVAPPGQYQDRLKKVDLREWVLNLPFGCQSCPSLFPYYSP